MVPIFCLVQSISQANATTLFMCHCIFGWRDWQAYECASESDSRGYDRLIDTIRFLFVGFVSRTMWHVDILGGANSRWFFFFPSEEESWVIGNNLQMLLDLSSFWKAKETKKGNKDGLWEVAYSLRVSSYWMLNKIDVGTIVGRNQEVIIVDHWHAIISIPTCLFALMFSSFHLEDWGKRSGRFKEDK